MPPITRTPPIIGTLGRRRRPVRSIRLARNAPRTPPQSPGEGRLPPVRVRLTSSQEAEHVPNPERAAAPAAPARTKSTVTRRSSAAATSNSEPLESLTLRSFAIGSFSRRSIAYFCAPATLSPFPVESAFQFSSSEVATRHVGRRVDLAWFRNSK